MVKCILAGITRVLVLNAIAKRINRLRELPGENMAAVLGIGDCRRVSTCYARRAVVADEPIFAANLPITVIGVVMVQDPREQPFRARLVARPGFGGFYRHKVFGTGEDESVPLL